jgi:hypothetical protein
MEKRGKKKGAPKTGGRTVGTPNRRTQELRDALHGHGCDIAEHISALLSNKETPIMQKIELIEKLLPLLWPQQKAIDPQGYLTIEQAAGMLGAQATKFQHALLARINDPALVAAIMEHLRGPQHSSGAESLPAF